MNILNNCEVILKDHEKSHEVKKRYLKFLYLFYTFFITLPFIPLPRLLKTIF